MRLTGNKFEQDTIENLRNISGQNVERISMVFQALGKLILMNYSEGKPTVVPYLGSLLIKNNGDVKTDKGMVCDLEIFFSPSDDIKENIGVYEDYLKGNAQIMDIPFIRTLDKDDRVTIKNNLTSTREEVDRQL